MSRIRLGCHLSSIKHSKIMVFKFKSYPRTNLEVHLVHSSIKHHIAYDVTCFKVSTSCLFRCLDCGENCTKSHSGRLELTTMGAWTDPRRPDLFSMDVNIVVRVHHATYLWACFEAYLSCLATFSSNPMGEYWYHTFIILAHASTSIISILLMHLW